MTHPDNPMMTADELRKLAVDLRNDKTLVVDDALVKTIGADVERYRVLFAARREQVPFAPLDELLPLMGWVIYEATWTAVQTIPATLNPATTTPEAHRKGEEALLRIGELADLAGELPWPEFAPRALGAIRAQALAESKRDNEDGYAAAWIAHKEARRRYQEYMDSHAPGEARDRFVRDLQEVLLQLNLAETGTACRTAERVISRWAEEFQREPEQRWIERMFRELTSGVRVGEEAIDTARRIEEEYGFVKSVTEERLTMGTALQNPGIMTARAASLLFALGPEMRRLGHEPSGFDTWEAWGEHVLGQFTKAYEAIEAPVTVDDEPVDVRSDLKRQLIQMRLNLALLHPGHVLPSRLSFDPCLQWAALDDRTLEILSETLAPQEGVKGQERGLGASTMPAFIRSINACRRACGAPEGGYARWRRTWFRLDRFADEPDRRANVETALDAAL